MIVLITFTYPNDGRKLKKLIQGLVQGKMVACAQVINYLHSHYLREGKFTKTHEKMVICKTISSQQEKAISRIQKQHPYQIPEIILQEVECNKAYEERVISVVKT